MPLPSSGILKISAINIELGKSNNASNTMVAGNISPTLSSLFGRANSSGSINITAPHKISEFYGYEALIESTILWELNIGVIGDLVIDKNSINEVTAFSNDDGNFQVVGGDFIEVFVSSGELTATRELIITDTTSSNIIYNNSDTEDLETNFFVINGHNYSIVANISS